MMYLCVHTSYMYTTRVYTDVQSAFLLLYISLTLLYVCVFGTVPDAGSQPESPVCTEAAPRHLCGVLHALGVNWTSIPVR